MQNWKLSNYHKLPKLAVEKFERNIFECQKYMELTDKDKTNLIQLKIFDNFKWHIELRPYNLGHTFGETALLAARPEKALRETTIKTNTQAGLAILSRDDFFTALRKVQERRDLDKNDFISKIPIFAPLKTKQIERLINKSEELQFQRNHVVFQQGSTAEDLFIVYDGEFEILRS